MELHSHSTRFALACNNSTKIIEPIQSRCAILRYSRLSDAEVAKRLIEVCNEENITRDDSGLEALIFTAEGDLRNALNALQSTSAGFGMVTADNVYRVCDTPHPLTIGRIINACLAQDIATASKFMGDMWRSGYSALDIVTTVFKVLKANNQIQEVLKLDLLQILSATHMRVVDGTTTLTQMFGLCAKLAAISKGRVEGQSK
jgi:replication factor C subunit 2/4